MRVKTEVDRYGNLGGGGGAGEGERGCALTQSTPYPGQGERG